jgi:hypothetical protein
MTPSYGNQPGILVIMMPGGRHENKAAIAPVKRDIFTSRYDISKSPV